MPKVVPDLRVCLWHLCKKYKFQITKIRSSLRKVFFSKRRSANMQQIYRRAPMQKCYFNNFWNSTLVHGCSPVKLLYICRTTFAYGEIFIKNKVTNHKRNRIICLSWRRYFTNNSKKPQACNFILKKTLAQMFSCDFCEIFKNTYFFRTPLVAASEL